MRYVHWWMAENLFKYNMPRTAMTLNARFIMKQDVRPELLLTALQDTLRLYPVFGLTFERDGDSVYLADNEEPVRLIRTDRILFPGETRYSGHLFVVGYNGRTVSISIDHCFTDGCGARTFFNTMLDRYAKLLNGTAEEITAPACDTELMLQQTPELTETAEEPYAPYVCPGEVIRLPALSTRKPYRILCCRISEEAFMNEARQYEANVFAMIEQVISRGIFATDTLKGDFVRANFVISTRKALGMEHSFANLDEFGSVDLRRDEAEDPACLKRIASDIRGQKSVENIRFRTAHSDVGQLGRFAEADTFMCSYLRVNGAANEAVEEHQTIPVFFGPVPKVDVRADGTVMSFTVTGSPECKVFYNAVMHGLELSGFDIQGENRMTVDIAEDGLAIVEE